MATAVGAVAGKAATGAADDPPGVGLGVGDFLPKATNNAIPTSATAQAAMIPIGNPLDFAGNGVAVEIAGGAARDAAAGGADATGAMGEAGEGETGVKSS
jgi:hypothetical protein